MDIVDRFLLGSIHAPVIRAFEIDQSIHSWPKDVNRHFDRLPVYSAMRHIEHGTHLLRIVLLNQMQQADCTADTKIAMILHPNRHAMAFKCRDEAVELTPDLVDGRQITN